MKGDFSRQTFRKENHYASVLFQQGRVFTDAGLNEEQTIQRHHLETAQSDMIGPSGTMRDDPGFGLQISADNRLLIDAGRYYVDGILCENEAATDYMDQPHFNATGMGDEVDTLLKGASTNIGLVYLDVWRRHITFLDNPLIQEKALSGADTTTRLQTVWQVKVLPLKERDEDEWAALTCDTGFPARDKLLSLSSGTMDARTSPLAETDDDCLLPPAAGYQRLENQLYRVEVHKGGSRAQATFKWSRENGSVVAAILAASGTELTVDSVGRDDVLGFVNGGWVEIVDDETALHGLPGDLLRVQSIDPANNRIVLSTAPTRPINLDLNPQLRRWDQIGGTANKNGVKLTSNWRTLEGGVEVQFTSGTYNTGDYWLIPARTADGQIEWPPNELPGGSNTARPPMGVTHHFADLGLVTLDSDGELSVLLDCRRIFPPLTDIQASDVGFDNAQCALPADVDTVQQALDMLCDRVGMGTCTITVFPGDDLQAAVNKIANGQDAQICFGTGTFELKETVYVREKGHIKVIGAGPGTFITAPSTESALWFEGCDSVLVRDLTASTGLASTTGDSDLDKGLRGTLTFRNCERVDVEHVALSCGTSNRRSACCLKVHNDHGRAEFQPLSGSARIQHCHLTVGHLQQGILLVNTPRAQVVDNYLEPGPLPAEFKLADRIQKDATVQRSASRTLVSGLRSGYSVKDDAAGHDRLSIASRETDFVKTVDIPVGKNSVRFEVPNDMVTMWDKIEIPRAVESTDDAVTFVRETIDNALLGQGDEFIVGEVLGWVNAAAEAQRAVITQGIVVAGREADDIRILNNTVMDVTQGIQVALSHRGAPAGRVGTDYVTNVLIANNTIYTYLDVLFLRNRWGIFIGSSQSTIIENNTLTRIDNDALGHVWVNGIQVWGDMGKRMLVSQNHTTNYNRGVYVYLLNEPPFRNNPDVALPKNHVWAVTDNVATVKLDADRQENISMSNNARDDLNQAITDLLNQVTVLGNYA